MQRFIARMLTRVGWWIVLSAIFFAFAISAQTGGPVPYAPVANPLPDTMDQLYRDSVNIKFSKIRVNQAGYSTADQKFFYVVGGTSTTFQVINSTGAQITMGTLTPTGDSTSGQLSIRASNNAALVAGGDTRYTMVSPVYAGPVSQGEIPVNIAPGRYRIVSGPDTSEPFMVDDRIYSWVKDALLKFYGVARSGNTDSWFHPPSHLLDGPNGDGSLTGGWYDCGDHLKESMSMSYTMLMLALSAVAFPDLDSDHYGRNQNNTYFTDGVPDMLYESKIGVDFFMKSYNVAQGDPSKMYTSVGNFGYDHSWWGQPQFQDQMPLTLGGPPRQVRNEVGSNIMGRVAAGLAFFSQEYAPYDSVYAHQCLAAAEKMYAYGKSELTASGSSGAYGTEGTINDDMGMAAVALLWATKDTTYKYDLYENTTLGTHANPYFTTGTFPGGWFAYTDPTLQKGGSNTSYANIHTITLWAFYKMVLKDPATAAACGIDATQRLSLIEGVVFSVINNIGLLQGGSATIDLPASNPQLWGGHTLTYDPLWKINTSADVIWVWNRYIAGNTTEFFCYYDIAKDLTGVALPHTPATTDWKADDVRQLMVRQMDYFLGVNPWDISMIYGVGSKNFNHPHHRAANPEGTNVPGAFYHYRPPVGALQGGFPPDQGLYTEYWSDYTHSESCIDGTDNILLPVVGLEKAAPLDSLTLQVSIVYVGIDSAVIDITQSRYGTALIQYGLSPTSLSTTVKASDSAGMTHRIVLTGLQSGTTYYFQAEAIDLKGITGINDNAGKKFVFTTLAQPEGPAQIAYVKVCNVTYNSADVLWYTPNGVYDSKVVYDTTKPPTQVQNGDVTGLPVKFHNVHLTGLKEQTQYWFYVASDGVINNNDGLYYTFTTPVQHVDFDIRALSYNLDGKQYLGFNIVNQDIISYDSLDVRLYVRGTIANMADFGVRDDIGQAYLSSGYLDPTNAFKTALDTLIQKQKPVRMDDTYDPVTDTYDWYISLPMGNAVMSAGARFRVDVAFVQRNANGDLLDAPSTHVVGTPDWSWEPHSTANGDPVNFVGIQPGTKVGVDTAYIHTPVDPYITVYRKGEFVYGYSPSPAEQATKISNFNVTAQITAPLMNLPEDYKVINQSSPTVYVKGTVAITNAGLLTDVWVNGVQLPSVSQVATFDPKANLWDLNIPIKLVPGPNEEDITLFGGADTNCQGCAGCAFADNHFYLQFNQPNAYPSSMVLLDTASKPVAPLAVIGQTRFLVRVTDKNGDQTPNPDSLNVWVYNPNQGDSLKLTLIETGDTTGVFQSTVPISVVNVPPSQLGPAQISMAEGDTVWVKYIDPTDELDSSMAFLYTPATFPQATGGWLLDRNGDGAVDGAVVLYSKPLTTVDSLQIWFPDPSSQRSFLASSGGFHIQGNRLDVDLVPVFPQGVTAFTASNVNSGRSFLTDSGITRISTFTLADSVGPVIRRAILFPSPLLDSAPVDADTLVVTFSEPINYAAGYADPFQAQQAGQIQAAAGLVVTQVLSNQGNVWTYLISPTSPVRLNPGDSLRIAGGIADLFANVPAPANPWVNVEGSTRLVEDTSHPNLGSMEIQWGNTLYHAGAWASDEKIWIVALQDPSNNLQPIGVSNGNAILPCAGSDCGAIPQALDGLPYRPSVVIASPVPFRFQARVYSHLGEFLSDMSGDIGPQYFTSGMFPTTPGGPPKLSVRLVWNARSENGNKAGTGVYIWQLQAWPDSSSSATGGISQTRRIGLIRDN